MRNAQRKGLIVRPGNNDLRGLRLMADLKIRIDRQRELLRASIEHRQIRPQLTGKLVRRTGRHNEAEHQRQNDR